MMGQVRDAGEVPAVAGDEGEVLVEGGGGDQEIEIFEQRATATEVSAASKEPSHDRLIERQDGKMLEESQESGLCRAWIRALVDPVVDLAVGDETDGQFTGSKRSRELVSGD